MTEKSTEKKANELDKLMREVRAYEADHLERTLLRGKTYLKIKQEKLWACAGTHIKKINDFFTEYKIAPSSFYHDIDLYVYFGYLLLNKGEIIDLRVRDLVSVLPIVKKSPKTAKDWVNKLKTLAKEGIDDEIREAKGKMPTDKCEHSEKKAYIVEKCATCGKNLGMRSFSGEKKEE